MLMGWFAIYVNGIVAIYDDRMICKCFERLQIMLNGLFANMLNGLFAK